MPAAPLVYVVDDDQAIRESLVLLLESSGRSARAFPDSGSFLAGFEHGAPGCVIADVRMPGMSGLDLQRHLKGAGIDLPVIIITGHADVAMAVQALKDGASDFIEKPFDEDVLARSVDAALDQNQRALNERKALDELRALAAELTPREREVMALVVQGLANKAVAAELNISVRTVEIHRGRVMEKMNAGSLSELVRMALRLDQ
ncbi:response regulator transcription factor [Magnetospirillum moscoviense]|uniref:DNA-binding response regulator n=1 Tax=Magnetospirillum moscoviense TaxID=1437059 RepID=A0A178MJ46_9PROT|nr:response regulator [Magnetospirillum moscoviense]MBF0324803.1 response regulator transcription factor [Alphaproteobacteria bacterium]OAN48752.1 DNA-binding response regulator [Magnetospirillum moscoviense]